MLKDIRAFSEGPKFHIQGIRFALKNPSFLALATLPFVVTLSLYVLGFYWFTGHTEDLLRLFWHVDPGESSRYIGWLYWAYVHVVKWILYILVMAVMFYTFVVFSNVLGSPVYDHISTKYERIYHRSSNRGETISPARGILAVMKEEVKKAVLMLVIPLLFFLIPVIGAFLSFVVAAIFIAWDFVDFSLSKDCPLLKDRIKALWRHKYHLIGFGCPLLIPFVGIVILPFAILGSTKLYYDRMRESNS
jgi:CysZ protein